MGYYVWMSPSVVAQIENHIAALPEPKQGEMRRLHALIVEGAPGCELWFLDGTNEEGRQIANPNIGYGRYTIRYANGTVRDWYQVGLSATKSGISVYVLDREDKAFLARTYGASIGKAKVTGYCISFKCLADVDLTVLLAAIFGSLRSESAKP